MISPPSGSVCAVSIRIVVDLPAPLGPSRPKQTPRRHLEVEAVDRGDLSVALDRAADRYRGAAHAAEHTAVAAGTRALPAPVARSRALTPAGRGVDLRRRRRCCEHRGAGNHLRWARAGRALHHVPE